MGSTERFGPVLLYRCFVEGLVAMFSGINGNNTYPCIWPGLYLVLCVSTVLKH